MTQGTRAQGMSGTGYQNRKKPTAGMHATLGAFNFSAAKPSMVFSPKDSQGISMMSSI